MPVEIGHDTVDDVGLRRDQVDGVDIGILGPTLFDHFDVGDALVQNVVGMEDIVEQLLAALVQDQDLPLDAPCVSKGGQTQRRGRRAYLALGRVSDDIENDWTVRVSSRSTQTQTDILSRWASMIETPMLNIKFSTVQCALVRSTTDGEAS